ncbi:MAG: histidinol-phosphate transaminase, partial [Planctomycetota bacterium]|nr:histidinol-phosphate transaminase [Planctomycetota bacterium]
EAIAAANNDNLRRYPDPESEALKDALAAHFQLPKNYFFVGNGSDEILAHVFHGLLQHEAPILFPDITYSFYPVYCGLYGVQSQLIPLTDQLEINTEDYKQANGGVIFPNPNAPTGRCLDTDSIEALLKANTESVVVVDEAYIDFGGQTMAAFTKSYPQLLVVQTFSKSRALAGLRVGFAIGQAHLIEALEKIKNSFNSYPLGRISQAGAVAALADKDYFEECRSKIITTRTWLAAELSKLNFDVIPSTANFIFVKHRDRDASELFQKLRERAIIVRHFKLPRIQQYMRITIGTQQECQALTDALKEILA